MFILDPLAERARLVGIIQDKAEGGFIAIVSRGKPLAYLRANVQSVLKWERAFYEIADYSESYRIQKPSIARRLEEMALDNRRAKVRVRLVA